MDFLTRDELKKVIGTVIKSERKRKNLSQDTVAEWLDVKRTMISRYESGASDMAASSLPILCDKYQMDMRRFDRAIKERQNELELEKKRQELSDKETKELFQQMEIEKIQRILEDAKDMVNESVFVNKDLKADIITKIGNVEMSIELMPHNYESAKAAQKERVEKIANALKSHAADKEMEPKK